MSVGMYVCSTVADHGRVCVCMRACLSAHVCAFAVCLFLLDLACEGPEEARDSRPEGVRGFRGQSSLVMRIEPGSVGALTFVTCVSVSSLVAYLRGGARSHKRTCVCMCVRMNAHMYTSVHVYCV